MFQLSCDNKFCIYQNQNKPSVLTCLQAIPRELFQCSRYTSNVISCIISSVKARVLTFRKFFDFFQFLHNYPFSFYLISIMIKLYCIFLQQMFQVAEIPAAGSLRHKKGE